MSIEALQSFALRGLTQALSLAQLEVDDPLPVPRGRSLEGLQSGIDVFVWVALAAIAAAGVYIFYKRGSTLLHEFDAQESTFELSARREFRAEAPGVRRLPGEPEFEPKPTNGDVEHFLAPSPPPLRPPFETQATAHPTGPLIERDLPPMAYSVVSRLRAGNMLNSIEGPARTAREDLTATVLGLRSGKRIVVIESAISRDDPAIEGLLRFYDGLIAPGPGPDPIYIRRFDSFIGEMFTM